jgi:hypothetical protein
MMLLGGDAISIDSANRGYDYDRIDSEPLWDRVQELELEHYQSLFGNSISICNRTLLDPQFSCGTIQTPGVSSPPPDPGWNSPVAESVCDMDEAFSSMIEHSGSMTPRGKARWGCRNCREANTQVNPLKSRKS